MTEKAVANAGTPKGKLAGTIRWVILGAMIGLLLLTIIMAAYRKFAG